MIVGRRAIYPRQIADPYMTIGLGRAAPTCVACRSGCSEAGQPLDRVDVAAALLLELVHGHRAALPVEGPRRDDLAHAAGLHREGQQQARAREALVGGGRIVALVLIGACRIDGTARGADVAP